MLPWNERLHGVGAQVIMELVHMHEGLVWFPAVAGLVESRPSDVELQGGSSIAVAAMSKDRLNDELLLIVLSYSQRIGADGIVDERAKVVDMRSDPLAGIESGKSITWNGPRCLGKSLLPRPTGGVNNTYE